MLSFLEQLDRVAAGALELEPVLSSFLGGLEAMLAQLEEAVEEAEASPATARLFETVTERFHEVHNLACDALELPRQGDIRRLRQAHSRLEHSLLAFHEASWVDRGPTDFAWANQVVEGLECFLEGDALPSELGALLDGLVLGCEKRGAAREAGPSRDLLFLLRSLADWARGSITLTPAELRKLLSQLPVTVERAQGWLRQARDRSLDRLLALLEGKPEATEVLALARTTLAEVERQVEETQEALRHSQGQTEMLIREVEETLGELEHTLRSLIEDVEGVWEWDFRDQLRDLCEHLAEHMQELEQALQTEGAVPCLACGGLNARDTRRCAHCSVVLPAAVGEEALLDTTVGEGEEPEGQNVRRLRLAVHAFAEGRLDAGGLASLIKELVALAARARAAVPSRSREALDPLEREYAEALDGIDQALKALGSVAHPQEAALWPNLELFVQSARQLRELREPVG